MNLHKGFALISWHWLYKNNEAVCGGKKNQHKKNLRTKMGDDKQNLRVATWIFKSKNLEVRMATDEEQWQEKTQ